MTYLNLYRALSACRCTDCAMYIADALIEYSMDCTLAAGNMFVVAEDGGDYARLVDLIMESPWTKMDAVKLMTGIKSASCNHPIVMWTY